METNASDSVTQVHELTDSSTIVGADSHEASKSDEENIRQSLNTISSTTSETALDVPRPSSTNQQSVGAALDWFNLKLAIPYLRFLNIVGLRPPPSSRDNCNCCKVFFNLYKFIVVLLVLVGYVLQYMSCFRRDRGFGYKEVSIFTDTSKRYDEICHGSFIFSYLIPDILHLCAYVHALYALNVSGDDQLQCLMERVFLITTQLRDGNRSKSNIEKTCHLFVLCNYVWLVVSFSTTIFMMSEAQIEFKWLPHNNSAHLWVLKGVLIFCTLWHDAIQVTVITNYCVQGQLLILYLQFLREKLLQYPVQPIEWMKEFAEFKKLLKYFNERLAPAAGLFTIVNLTWAFAGTFWVFHFDHLDKENLQTIGVNLLNCCLWVTIAIVPFIQAARLTNACEKAQGIGHEVRTRPFVHQDMPDYKLDSILLYASTLRLSSRLYKVPINGRYLISFIVFCTVILLVLGQLHYINTAK